jgi:hypothetical protein
MYYPTLRAMAQQQLKKIGQADLIIGLPTHKNPKMAARVAKVALDGVHKYLPELRTVLINADAGQNVDTRRAVLAQAPANGHLSHVVSGRYTGQLGQGNATAALLDAALALDARAIVILDSQSDSIGLEWVAGLAHLVLENKADLVFPRYRQWLMPAAMLNDLVTYPLFRALWGKSLRHPVASDFAMSPQLAAASLDEDVWGTSTATFGLMPWLATYTLLNNWRMVQTALGKKCVYPEDQPQTVHPNFYQFESRFFDTVTKMFSLMYQYRNCWQHIEQVQSLPTLTQYAIPQEFVSTPEEDLTHLLDALPLGWMEYRRLWQKILNANNLAQLEALAALPSDQFYFPADLWARIIYDFAVAFNLSEADPAQIVNSLLPIYHGRLAAFLQEVAGLALVGHEGTVAAQAVEFEELRPYLKKMWQANTPGRYLPGIDNRSL